MERDEIFSILIAFFIFGPIGFLISGYNIASGLLSLIIVFYPVLFFVRWRKYKRSFGIEKISNFSCRIFDGHGELASFRGDDWTLLELPVELVTEKNLEIKSWDESIDDWTTNKKINLDFLGIYEKLVNEWLSTIIPEPITRWMQCNNCGNVFKKCDLNYCEKCSSIDIESHYEKIDPISLDYKIKTLRDPQISNWYDILSTDNKSILAKTFRRLLVRHFTSKNVPKLYFIVSLTNEVYMYWFAPAPPSEYYSYRENQWYGKWKIVPWRKGFPVVEMFGKEINITHDLGGFNLRTIQCMPIQDEGYRAEKSFNLKRYGVFAESFAVYTENVLEALPSLAFLRTLQTERQRYKEQSEAYRLGLMTAEQDISAVSTSFITALSMLSKAIGAISKLPGLPERAREMLSDILPAMDQPKSKLSEIGSKVQTLLTGQETIVTNPDLSSPIKLTEKKDEQR